MFNPADQDEKHPKNLRLRPARAQTGPEGFRVGMPHWLIKSGIQRVISWLPASARWNELFQRYVTRSIDLSEKAFEGKLEEADRFLQRFRRHQPLAPDSFTAFEIGTGWYPTLPIAFYLCGASEIHTFDIASLLNPG